MCGGGIGPVARFLGPLDPGKVYGCARRDSDNAFGVGVAPTPSADGGDSDAPVKAGRVALPGLGAATR